MMDAPESIMLGCIVVLALVILALIRRLDKVTLQKNYAERDAVDRGHREKDAEAKYVALARNVDAFMPTVISMMDYSVHSEGYIKDAKVKQVVKHYRRIKESYHQHIEWDYDALKPVEAKEE